MALGSLERVAGYARQRGVRDPGTMALTSRQQRRIRHKLGRGLRAGRKPPRRTEVPEVK
jgi:hypothetical protein